MYKIPPQNIILLPFDKETYLLFSENSQSQNRTDILSIPSNAFHTNAAHQIQFP